MLAYINGKRIAGHNIELAGITGRNFLQRGYCALIALDGNNATGPEREQCAREAARAGPDLDNGDVLKGLCRARDACGQIEVEQEILAKGFFGRETMAADDVA